MTTHTDTDKLKAYNAQSYPSLDGGVPVFITKELQKLQTSIATLIAVMKLMETRMNTNGLT